MKKAMIIHNSNKYVDISDLSAVAQGYKKVNFRVESYHIDELYNLLDSIDVSSYDVIAYTPLSNALFNSGKHRKETLLHLINNSKEKAMTLFLVDISFAIDPYIWDEGETSKDKVNVFKDKPVKVIVSLSDEVKEDEKALERINKIWLSKLHEDSELHFAEFLTLHKLLPAIKSENVLPLHKKYRNMYYGIKKPKLLPSLKRLNMTTEKDLAYGTCMQMLTECTGINGKKLEWLKLLPYVEKVVFPYEDIKGDYQITLRAIEANRYYKDKVVIDDLVSQHIKNAILDDDYCLDTVSKTIERLKKIAE